ncbi:MAG: OmpA family protein [Flammeovirgaceae bacterium]
MKTATKFKLALFILIICAATGLQAQKKKTPNPKKILSKAREAVRVQEYYHAMPLLEQLDSMMPKNQEMNYLYGVALMNLNDPEAAQKRFLVASSGSEEFDNINYYLGKTYHLNHDFDSAAHYYEKHMALASNDGPSKSEIELYIKQCEVGKTLLKDTLDVKIYNLGENVNTAFPDFAPVISADETRLIFTSRREGNTGPKEIETNLHYEDIYIVEKDENGDWGKPVNIGDHINTPSHDASIGLSPDGDELYIYRANETSSRLSGDIYFSDYEKGEWTRPKKMQDGINSKNWEPHASITADEQMFFFTSNRQAEGAQGGRDIYWVRRLPDLSWAKPVNLSIINSPYDEDSPFIHPDGKTLYFSSNGPESMGGFDIFISELDTETGTWSKPKNMGYPINTSDDDIYFVWSADGMRGYFSSQREDTFGEKDIYMVSFPEKKVNLIVLKGVVTDVKTNEPLAATIEVVDNKTQKTINIATSNDFTGKYTVILPPNKDYGIRVTREGYLFKSININVPDQFEYLEVVQNVALKPIDYNQYEGLENIKFAEDFSLRVESEPELSELKELFNQLPEGYKVEVMVHSDNSKDSLLSVFETKAKADAIVAKLKEDGVDPDAVVGSGVGPRYPAFNNESELSRKKNNRVEYIVRKDLEDIGIATYDPNFEDTARVAPKADEGELVHIDHQVFFKPGSSILDERSYIAIDEIVRYMEAYPKTVLEVGGHTDNLGTHTFNMKLSERRASVVVQQIVFRGVPKKRLYIKGYGETEPIASNATQEGRAKNRRTEFKILKVNDDGTIGGELERKGGKLEEKGGGEK